MRWARSAGRRPSATTASPPTSSPRSSPSSSRSSCGRASGCGSTPTRRSALADLVGPDRRGRPARSCGGPGGGAGRASGPTASSARSRSSPTACSCDLVDRLRTARDDRAPRLVGVDATLRAYQSTGVAWLQALGDLGIGALLADDMGLGKTLQTIALLAGRAGDRPHLVVCPTSVVGNWERELARFAPALPVLRHHGPDRPDDPSGFPAGTVAVTTYGLLRRDADLLVRRRVGRRRARRGPADQEPRCPHRPGRPAAHRGQPRRPHRHPGREPAVRAVVDHRVRQPGPARAVRPVPRALRRSSRALARPRRRRPAPPRRGAVHAAPHQVRPGHRGRAASEDRGHGRLHAHPRAGHPVPGGGAHAARRGRPRRGHRAPRPHPQAAHGPQADLQPPGPVPRRARAAARAVGQARPDHRDAGRGGGRRRPRTRVHAVPRDGRAAGPAPHGRRWGWRRSRSCTAGSLGAAATPWSPGSRTARRRRS